MFAFQLILFTYVISFAVLEEIHEGVDEHLNMNRLSGIWYTNGIINPFFENRYTFACSKTNIAGETIKSINNVRNEVILNGVYSNFEGNGTIIDDDLYIYYHGTGTEGSKFAITFFNNKQEMILNDRNDTNYYLLLSKSTNFSEEITTAFENHAANIGTIIMWINQTHCDQRVYNSTLPS